MALLAGVVGLSIDGAPQKVKAQLAWQMGGLISTVIGGNAIWGHTQTVEPGEITLKIVVDAATDLNALQSVAGATLTIELDVGVTLVMANAVVTASVDASVGAGDNEATIVFGGDPIEEA